MVALGSIWGFGPLEPKGLILLDRDTHLLLQSIDCKMDRMLELLGTINALLVSAGANRIVEDQRIARGLAAARPGPWFKDGWHGR
jgi:hypothetical protein